MKKSAHPRVATSPSGPKWKNAAYVTYTRTELYEAPPEKVFPLFCPIREYDYMRDWGCTMNHSVSGYAEKNAVFQSRYAFPFGRKATWVCTNYVPRASVTYTVFLSNILVFVLDHTSIEELPDGGTKDTVTYSVFGLNWLGKLVARRLSKTGKLEKIASDIAEEVRHYLKYGRKMPKGK